MKPSYENEHLWPTGERVPTTLHSLGRDRTLRLIIQGYLMTKEVLTSAFETHQLCQIPEPDRLTKLLS